MNRSTDRPPRERKSRLGDYVITAVVVLSLAGLMIVTTWRITHQGLSALKPPENPVGWGPGWDCVGASMKSGGFCIRKPTSEPRRKHPKP